MDAMGFLARPYRGFEVEEDLYRAFEGVRGRNRSTRLRKPREDLVRRGVGVLGGEGVHGIFGRVARIRVWSEGLITVKT